MSSDPMKMDSRYCHFFCTVIHASSVSPISDRRFSHACTCDKKGPTNLDADIELRFIRLSSRMSVISSVARRHCPRSAPSRSYLYSVSSCAFQLVSTSSIPFSICTSLDASVTTSSTKSDISARLSAKSCASVKEPGLISTVGSSFFQCRGRIASFLSIPSSGSEFWKDTMFSLSLS